MKTVLKVKRMSVTHRHGRLIEKKLRGGRVLGTGYYEGIKLTRIIVSVVMSLWVKDMEQQAFSHTEDEFGVCNSYGKGEPWEARRANTMRGFPRKVS